MDEGIPEDMVARIQKFVNRRISLKNENSEVSKFFSFPSYCDVLKICGDVNREKNLGFQESVVEDFGDYFPPDFFSLSHGVVKVRFDLEVLGLTPTVI